MSRLIHNWKELASIPNESKTHILKIDLESGNGYLIAKNPKLYKKSLSYMRQILNIDVYLSTHTFYGTKYKWSTKILRVCGFDVELDNCDKQEVKEDE